MEYLFIEYRNMDNCLNSYPYLEENSKEDILCKTEIKTKLNNIFSIILNDGYLLYEFPLYQINSVEVLLKDSFLFYSSENAIKEKYYIFSKENGLHYLSLEEFYAKSKNDILISNDFDGLGIWFIAHQEKLFIVPPV